MQIDLGYQKGMEIKSYQINTKTAKAIETHD